MANRAAQKQNNRAQIQALEDALKQKDAKIAELEQRLDRLTELLVNAQRARFGQSSEKQKYVMKNAKQMSFFNEAETEQNPNVKTGVGLPPARKKLATLPDFSFHLAGGSATPNRI